MKNKINYKIITGFILSVIFVIFTILVKFVDVQPSGVQNTQIGFATINKAFSNLIGYNAKWYNVTDWLGFIPLIVALIFACTGLIQLLKRKKILKVDIEILLLGCLYIAIFIFYVFFEKVIINYRPIIIDKYPEASYPSSHTMIALCILITAISEIYRLIKNKFVADLLTSFCIAFLFVIVIGRILSGVHYLTDIIGAVILSSALIYLYYGFVQIFKK